MNNIKNEDIALLFKALSQILSNQDKIALSQILSNQDKINKHFGINKYDSEWGYDDNETESLARQCYSTAYDYDENQEV